MQPPALPCRRLFILSLPKNLFSMKKLFGSYLFWTRTLSVLCILLFPVVELLVCGDVSVAVCTLLMSESGGAAMLLATPCRSPEARPCFWRPASPRGGTPCAAPC